MGLGRLDDRHNMIIPRFGIFSDFKSAYLWHLER